MRKPNFRHIHATIAHLLAIGKSIPGHLQDFLPKKPKKPGAYIPGGPDANVRGTYVRNPSIASQMNAMHEKWMRARFPTDHA